MNIWLILISKKLEADDLDRFYRQLLKLLSLTESHCDHLLKERKLSVEETEKKQYRSLIANFQERLRITKQIIRELREEPEGIPGFYYQETPSGDRVWTLAARSGILIPFQDLRNRIVGLQVRVDQPDYIDVFGPFDVKMKMGEVCVVYLIKQQVHYCGKEIKRTTVCNT